MTMFAINNIKSVTILTVGLLSAGLYGCGHDKKHAESCLGLDHNKTWVNEDNTPTKDHGVKCFNCIKSSSEMKGGKFDWKKDMDADTKKKFEKAFHDGANSCGHNEAIKLDDELDDDFLKWVKSGNAKPEELPCAHLLGSFHKDADETLQEYIQRVKDQASGDMKDCGKCITDNNIHAYEKCFVDPNVPKHINPTACTNMEEEVKEAAKASDSLSNFINNLPALTNQDCADCLANNMQSLSLSTDKCGLVGVGADLNSEYDRWVLQEEEEEKVAVDAITAANTDKQFRKLVTQFETTFGVTDPSAFPLAVKHAVEQKGAEIEIAAADTSPDLAALEKSLEKAFGGTLPPAVQKAIKTRTAELEKKNKSI